MASFVGDGIVTKISFKKSYDLWGNKEYLSKDDILKILSKRINMNLYDVIDTADGFILLLNPRLVNEHLHDLLKEIAHINFLSVKEFNTFFRGGVNIVFAATICKGAISIKGLRSYLILHNSCMIPIIEPFADRFAYILT